MVMIYENSNYRIRCQWSGSVNVFKMAGKLDTEIQVDIFDPAEEPAVGLAYGKDTDHLLLNAFPTAMSLNPKDPFEFSNWLEKHYPKYNARVDLVPRTVFGEYASERLAPLVENEKVTHIQTEIIDTTVQKEKTSIFYTLEDVNGKQYSSYDYLFFAIGNPPYKDFYNLKGHKNYIHDPYPVVEKLRAIDEESKVAIIGSNLTAFDLANYLSHEKDLQQPLGIFTIVPFFNSLRVPPYQGPALKYSLDKQWIEAEIFANKGSLPLDRIVEVVIQDLKENKIDIDAIHKQYGPADLKDTHLTYVNQEHPELSKVQGYIARLSGNLGNLYMALSNEDRKRYHSDYAPLFGHYQVRLAPDAVTNMYELLVEDQLFVVPDLTDVTKDDTFILTSESAQSYEAVVVPSMLHVIEEGYGQERRVPQLVLAGASMDDVFVIVLFSAFLAIAFGGDFSAVNLLEIPLAILIGILIGFLIGWLTQLFFRRFHMSDTSKVIMLLSLSFLLLEFEALIADFIPFSGLLAIMALGFAINHFYPRLANRLALKYNKLWTGAQILLFVLVGANVDITYALKAGIPVLLLIIGALILRMVGVLISLLPSSLNKKEKLFAMISYTPKATVQAAIGGVPLAMGLESGQFILTVAVLSILITAPLGSFAIERTYKKLLPK